MSCGKYADKRKACRETWAALKQPNVSVVFFSGKSEPSEPDLITLSAPDDYMSCAEKVGEFFRWALLQVGWEWLVKCDDDTYLDIERLEDLIKGMDVNSFAGNDHIFKKSGFAGGGSGYILHRGIIENMVNDDYPIKKGYEDRIISSKAIKHGAVPWPTKRLWYCKSIIPTSRNDQVTCHRVKPHEMRAIHSIRHFPELMRLPVVNSAWADTLVFYHGGGFQQLNRLACGAFEQMENHIILRWFEWPVEKLSREWVCHK